MSQLPLRNLDLVGDQFIKLYNDSYSAILGDKHPAALGRRGEEVWPEIWHIVGPMLRGVIERGEATWSDDLLLPLNRHGYKEECYFTFSYSPIRDATGGIGGIFTPVQETTGRVIAERRERTIRDLGATRSVDADMEQVCRTAARTLAQNGYDVPFAAIYLLDGRGAARLAGQAGIEPGSPLAPAVANLEVPEAWPPGAHAYSGGELDIRSYGDAIPRGAWDVPPSEALVLPLSPAGQQIGFLVVGVNPRKRLDGPYRGFCALIASQISTAMAEARAFEQERKRVQVLEELDRAKTRFFSNVSHEFRTPLTLLLAPLEEVLQHAGEVPPPALDAVQVAHRNALRLQRLVNTLLDFSRIEAGGMQMNLQPTDLAAFTADLAANFRAVVERAGLQFGVHCPALPEAVRVDRQMWEKVVLNLLSNAFKFTFEGSIAVSLEAVDDRVELTVSDTGTGIPAEELPHIFQRFHRVEGSRARTFEGTGIGLALVAELAELHGGTVRVASRVNEGTTFTVAIPRGRPGGEPETFPRVAVDAAPNLDGYVDDAGHWAARQVEAEGPGARRGERGRLLLVDDNEDMRTLVQRLLAGRFDVTSARNGQEGLEIALQDPPDVVLTDVMMPRLDGFGLLKALRAEPRTRAVPVIMLSARAGEESMLEGIAAGADDYLVKPFTGRELLARVESHYRISRERLETGRRLASSESELRLAMNAMPALVAYVDEQMRYVKVNSAMADWFGLRIADIEGKRLEEALPGETYEGILPFVKRALQGKTVSFESEATNHAGATRTHLASYTPDRDADGHVRGFVSLRQDVTERKQSEKAIAKSQDRLRLATEAGCIGGSSGISKPDKLFGKTTACTSSSTAPIRPDRSASRSLKPACYIPTTPPHSARGS